MLQAQHFSFKNNMSFLTKIFGDPNEREIKKLRVIVNTINELEQKFEFFSNEQFSEQTDEFKERLKNNASGQETLDNILPEAFACVREAAKRTLSQRHFDAQIIGGIVLHQGKIAEMKTGEGKTLAATLPAYLNALEGKGVHIVTVNDYLARRDTNWMGPIYHLLGLKVACINHEKSYIYEPYLKPDQNEVTIEMENLKEVSRREAYEADITYGTNNEFGFDYLRDNMAQDLREMVQREPNYAIVDEIDSILIDEARTPLIISMPDVESNKMYDQFARIVPRLKENIDYNIDEKMRTATLTEDGISQVEKILGVENIYDCAGMRHVHHLEQALKANVLFQRDRDYVVKDGEIIIVDEFTGRLMPGRRYSEGLHQALEAKEGVMVQKESRTLATITFQNYFRMYKKLAGMTGTAVSSAEEFHKVYTLDVLAIPTNKSMIRLDSPDSIYRTENGKFQAVIREIKERHQKGQPVLVGTVSIEKNEKLSALLQREGIPHQVLNAKHHEEEARIIAQAGRRGIVTIATNMAGRGVDIILGGRPEDFREGKEDFSRFQLQKWQQEHGEVVKLDGLHIIGTERHEARRIDNQLRGRAGRQGDPGSSQFFISLEDDLMRIFGPERIKKMMEFLKIPEDQPIESKMVSGAIESAQEKIEGYNFDIRKHVLEYDDVMNKQRETIYAKRRSVLSPFGGSPEGRQGQNIKSQILQYIEEEIKKAVEFHTQDGFSENWNIEEICEITNSIFLIPSETRGKLRGFKTKEEIIDYLTKLAKEIYEFKEKEVGEEKMRQIEKMVFLRMIDMLWMDHLENMEYLRDSVRLRAYGQQDPLVEYKKEGHKMFYELLAAIQASVAETIFKVSVQPVVDSFPKQVNNLLSRAPQQTSVGLSAEAPRSGAPASIKTSAGKKAGRNDPCPCGSGKKYKKCHGK